MYLINSILINLINSRRKLSYNCLDHSLLHKISLRRTNIKGEEDFIEIDKWNFLTFDSHHVQLVDYSWSRYSKRSCVANNGRTTSILRSCNFMQSSTRHGAIYCTINLPAARRLFVLRGIRNRTAMHCLPVNVYSRDFVICRVKRCSS